MTEHKGAFAPVEAQVSFPELEMDVLGFWKEVRAFERSVERRPESNRYVFYDGPPFATGLPHYGHLVASTIKDIVPRYWTMRGYRIERRFGWDTHGLPIEMLMEKKLGLSGPTSIQEYGVGEFNEACRSNVLTYTEEWRRTVSRIGRWVDFDNDYKTMDLPFMETVWWVFGQLWKKGLIYEDFRVMPYSWRLSTSLSNFEANKDYREVQDPAITVSMPLVGESNVALLIWTTTPWTLPSNLAIAVGEDIEYVRVRRPDDEITYIVARDRIDAVFGKDKKIVGTTLGKDLVGSHYEPLFDFFSDHAGAFRIIASDHVTTNDGTGLVHMAPDFGEDDFHACKKEGIQVLQSVDDEGRFVDAVEPFAGRNIKEADPDIIRLLKGRGRVFDHSVIQHSYPYCERSGTPLIYKAVPARFVRVEALRKQMVAHNDEIHWVPEAVGQKRFQNWLNDARDWNVSRNRFWGTPIPIWRCDDCHDETCVGSIEELEKLVGEPVNDLHPHRIDHLTFQCQNCGGAKRRIADVFDCWFESGCMPYAQQHYPFENEAVFEANFPAQFIAEGLDQTRGWFYTLLVLSTALFDKPPFRNCVVNGMVLADDGSKMSKSKQNYPAPDAVLDVYGADALRAYLINSPVVRAEPLRFNESGVREVVRTVLIPLRNAWSFFVQYANIDGFHPQSGLPDTPIPDYADRGELDRWILSVQQSLVHEVNVQMEGYYLYRVVPPIIGFIDDLTNWYIRRSRRLFWRSADDVGGRKDKAAAYATLYEVLVTFAQIMAPVLPFVSEAMYRSLVVEPGCAAAGEDSVHFCDYPSARSEMIDPALETEVALVRQVVSMGRALRERHKLKTRQPLRSVIVVHHEQSVCDAVAAYADLIAEELNVKAVLGRRDDQDLTEQSFKANFKTLGRRFGKKMKAAAVEISELSQAAFGRLKAGEQLVIEGEPITIDDILITQTPKGDVVIEVDGPLTVALDPILDESLIREGLARELTSRIQRLRKDSGLSVTDRIRIEFQTASDELRATIDEFGSHISEEVLAESFTTGLVVDGEEMEVDGHSLRVKFIS